MATMDTIKLFGGSPANFLDVGGGATAEKVTAAFKIMLSNPKVKAILVNIFGGIMKCDTIAAGVVAAAREVKLSVPLVVRMKGTNEDLGKKILKDSGLPIISADNMAEAGQKVVAAIAKKKPLKKPSRRRRRCRRKPGRKGRRNERGSCPPTRGKRARERGVGLLKKPNPPFAFGSRPPCQGVEPVMSILIDKNTRVVTQGITGKTGMFHTQTSRAYANGKECVRRRRESEEGGRELRRHSDFRHCFRSEKARPA